MSNQSENFSLDSLSKLNDDIAKDLIPAMVYIGLLMVLGVVGNLVVCFVFVFRLRMTTQHFLIIWLAVFDLLSSLIAMPSEIADMRFFYMFESDFACRLMRFINSFCAFASIFTLVIIAVDRYLKICRPLKRQMSLHRVKVALAAALLIALLLAIPAAFLYGIRSVETSVPGIQGQDCTTSDKVKDTKFPLVYNSVLFLAFVILLTTLTVIYVRIYREMKRHNKYMARNSVSSVSKFCPTVLSELSESDSEASPINIQAPENDSDINIQAPENDSDNKIQAPENDSDNKIQAPENDSDSKIQAPVNDSDSKIQAPENDSDSKIQAPENDSDNKIQIPENDSDNKIQAPENDSNNKIQIPDNNSDKIQIPDNNSDKIQIPDNETASSDVGNSKKKAGIEPDGPLNSSSRAVFESVVPMPRETNHQFSKEDVAAMRYCMKSDSTGHEGEEHQKDDAEPQAIAGKCVTEEDVEAIGDEKDTAASRHPLNSLFCCSDDKDTARDATDNGDKDSQKHKPHAGYARDGNDVTEIGHEDQMFSSLFEKDRQETLSETKSPVNEISAHKHCVKVESPDLLKPCTEQTNSWLVPQDRETSSPVLVTDTSLTTTSTNASITCSPPASPSTAVMNKGNQSEDSESPAQLKKSQLEVLKGRLTKRKSISEVTMHKTTMIAMSVTLVFFLSFVPHLSLVTARIISVDFDRNLTGVTLVLFNIFLRSYFINSVSNPIIYGVQNSKFRAECLQLVRKILFCRKQGSFNSE